MNRLFVDDVGEEGEEEEEEEEEEEDDEPVTARENVGAGISADHDAEWFTFLGTFGEGVPQPSSSSSAFSLDGDKSKIGRPLDIGVKRRRRERQVGPEKWERRTRPRPPETQRQRLEQRLRAMMKLLLRMPRTNLSTVLLFVFVPTANDFPYFTKPKPRKLPTLFGETEEEEEEEEEELTAPGNAGRAWAWNRILDIATAFTWLSDFEWHERSDQDERFLAEDIVNELRSPIFMRAVWRRWLDGSGGGTGAGKCTGAALFPGFFEDRTEQTRIASDARWYTRGFLSSVVLHHALLNSARNVLNCRAMIKRLTAHVIGEKLVEQNKAEPYLLTYKTPYWINRWFSGDLITPEEWQDVFQIDQWNAGWFAPQMAHGFLYLDLFAPERAVRGTRLPEQHAQGVADDWFVPPRSIRHLKFMQQNILDGDRRIPMVVRIPAVAIGWVLAHPSQVIWGYTTMEDRESWVRIPTPNHDETQAAFKPSHPRPAPMSGGLVVSGIRASRAGKAPMLGLALPDEPGPDTAALRGDRPRYVGRPMVAPELAKLSSTLVTTDTTADEREKIEAAVEAVYRVREDAWKRAGLSGLNATDNFTRMWYATINDVWLADVRLDTPHAILLFLSRVGGRSLPTIDNVWAPHVRNFERRLADLRTNPEIMRYWANLPTLAYRYLDGKNFVLSRCWTPPATERWLRGRRPDPQFYDVDRKLWVLDVGDSTSYVYTLQLLRCHGGPALPTVVPDLRLMILVYAVPVYRDPVDERKEDLPRIANHGRLDRILVMPSIAFVLDRVALSKEFFSNSADWITLVQHVHPGGGFRIDYAPPFGWLQTQDKDTDEWNLVYDWGRLEAELQGRDYEARLIRHARKTFGVPWEGQTRNSLHGMIELVKWAERMKASQIRRPAGLLSWTNVLFVTQEDQPTGNRAAYSGSLWSDGRRIKGNPVGDWMQAVDQAGAQNTFSFTWLALHPRLRHLGGKVQWNRVGFRLCKAAISRQLSVRLGMTTFPRKRDPTLPDSLFDRLMRNDVVQELQGIDHINRQTLLIIDLDSNALEPSATNKATMTYLNRAYADPDTAGLLILIGNSPLEEHLRNLLAFDINMFDTQNSAIGVFNFKDVDALRTAAREYLRSGFEVHDRTLEIMHIYRRGPKVDQTQIQPIGGIELRDESLRPLLTRGDTNPYGENPPSAAEEFTQEQ